MTPTLVHEVELSAPLEDLSTDYLAARVLVRLHGTPLGFVDVPVDGGVLTAEQVRREAAHLDLASHLASDGIADPLEPGGPWACQADGPGPAPRSVSVVLCTRDREESLRVALSSVLAACRPDVEVVVVDNAPRTAATRAVVDDLADPRVRYLLEPRPGLSVARNTGARASRGELIAFTDDDVVVDQGWVDALVRGVTRAPRIGCVTGLVPSGELDTEAQHFFDRKLDWSGTCAPRLYDLHSPDHSPDDSPDGSADLGPLYPYSAGIFGTGANFAVTREAFEGLGGFDEALGAGALTRGGEDLDWFLRTLQAGFVLAYEPSAVVWHRHRRDLASLSDQLYGYGTGFTAYLLKHALTRRGFTDLTRRLVRGAVLMRRAGSASAEAGIDPTLLRRERIGMLHGPVLYARARWRARR